MKKEILISIIILSSFLTIKAQVYIPNGKIQGSSGNNNIGIGINQPNAKLHINQTGGGWADGIRLTLGTNNWNIVADGNGDRLLIGPNQSIKDGLVLRNGKMSIGVSSPSARLHINQIGDGWASGIRLTLGANNWNIVADKSGDRLLISPNQSITNGLIFRNGNIGIGNGNPNYKLDVCGTIRAKEVKVDLNGTCVPDFVFKNDYKLMDLRDLEDFVKTNRHLPDIASEKEMVEKGVDMKELQMKLLQKIEELTLYTIEQNKKIEQQSEELKLMKEKVGRLESTSR